MFKINATATTLTITNPATGAFMKFKVDAEGNLQNNGREHGTELPKGISNATLLGKYIRDHVNAQKTLKKQTRGSIADRIKVMADILKGLAPTATSFRTLNNNLRRSTDDNTIFATGTYFYEGTSHPTKVAAREAAGTPAPKAKAKAAPAPAAKPAKAKTKATTPATAKATTPATKKATKKATSKKATPVATPAAAKPKAARKPKVVAPTPAAVEPVADNTPDEVIAPVAAPETVTVPETPAEA